MVTDSNQERGTAGAIPMSDGIIPNAQAKIVFLKIYFKKFASLKHNYYHIINIVHIRVFLLI